MIKVGDKILVVVSGPFGHGLVEATVTRVYVDHGLVEVHEQHIYALDAEGVWWCRGHDRESPQAKALEVAAGLR